MLAYVGMGPCREGIEMEDRKLEAGAVVLIEMVVSVW